MPIDLRTILDSGPERPKGTQPKFQTINNLSVGKPTTDENAIIMGDNLLALRLLKQRFKEKVRCAYIDPPYNNQERYTHYSDDEDHEKWLDGVVSRVRLLKDFLREDGSLWISIDDRQVHYLKVAVDEIFGRKNFATTIIWEQRTTRENRKVFSNNHEYVLVYAKNLVVFKKTRECLEWNSEVLSRYRNPDNDPRGSWQSISANVQDGHATAGQFYELTAPNGRRHKPPKGRCWCYTRGRMSAEIAQNNVYFGKDGNGVPRLKRFLAHAQHGLTPHTLWKAEEVGSNDLAKKHLLTLFPSQPLFDTPKPEGLIHRILNIATNEGDLVLDAYLGSGTTAAVAHKMQRAYIGIESGDHAATHCVDRIRKVIGGEQGGVSKTLGWTGGGSFQFYKLNREKGRSLITSGRNADSDRRRARSVA